jgi:phytoene synthase
MTSTTEVFDPLPPGLWDEKRWDRLDRKVRRAALAADSEERAWEILAKGARLVLKTYSTSFFLVTRFLPPRKRIQVEAIYAAVRYPDEIVDTFSLSPSQKSAMIGEWELRYAAALATKTIRESLETGAPVFIAGFVDVVRRTEIPHHYYHAFLNAMRMDIRPQGFETLEALIDEYIYGSATVVGYFLTYVYGASTPNDFDRALQSARSLAIALQLTNFLRDVAEDQRRGRVYLPRRMLRSEGIVQMDAANREQQAALHRVLRNLTVVAEDHYERALVDLDAFHIDSRVAIRACIDVYRRLNDRIGASPRGILHRERVPMTEKFRALPRSKYWRLPLAYLRF